MSTAQFKVGETYRTRDGRSVLVENVTPLQGRFITDPGMLYGWNQQGRWSADGLSGWDLMLNEASTATDGRLDKLEAQCTDIFRQLRDARQRISANSELIAGMAAKAQENVDRLDGTDRRVAALKEGLNDAHDVLVKHEDRLTAIEKRSAWKFLAALMAEFHGQDVANRVRKLESQTYEQEKVIQSSGIGIMAKSVIAELNAHSARVGAVEATLARIEDMLTSESNRKLADLGTGELVKVQSVPEYKVKTVKEILQEVRRDASSRPRKSLGWINVFVATDSSSMIARGGPRINGPFDTKAQAMEIAAKDFRPIMTHVSCIEVFEGDGL